MKWKNLINLNIISNKILIDFKIKRNITKQYIAEILDKDSIYNYKRRFLSNTLVIDKAGYYEVVIESEKYFQRLYLVVDYDDNKIIYETLTYVQLNKLLDSYLFEENI